MHPINVDTPTNLVKVLVLSISEAKNPKPKIIQPLAFLIPLQPNQKKRQSISSTKDSCTSASKKVHLYSNLWEPFIKPRRIVSWLSITIAATTATRHTLAIHRKRNSYFPQAWLTNLITYSPNSYVARKNNAMLSFLSFSSYSSSSAA